MQRFLLFLFATLLLCCNEDKELERKEAMAGIALSFDDNFADNWYEYQSLFDSCRVKVTFYVCRYNYMTASEKQKLKTLQAKGHEIAFHTCNHLNAAQELKKTRIADYVKNEILAGLNSMRKDGFLIENFAYPYGAFTSSSDSALAKHFKSLRKVEIQGWDELLTASHANSFYTRKNDNHMLYAACIDQSSGISREHVRRMLDKVVKENRVLMLYGHYISNSDGMFYTDPAILRFILQQANLRKMRFYTTAELCRF